MRVIICGSRHLRDYGFVCRSMNDARNILSRWITVVVSGAAKGADLLGEQWAMEQQEPIPIKRFDADWDGHGRAAGPIRNEEMARYADACVAFPCGESRGTRDMIRRMIAKKKPVLIYEYPEM